MWMRVWLRGWPWTPLSQLPRGPAPRLTSTWKRPGRLTPAASELLCSHGNFAHKKPLSALSEWSEFHQLMFSPGDGCK